MNIVTIFLKITFCLFLITFQVEGCLAAQRNIVANVNVTGPNSNNIKKIQLKFDLDHITKLMPSLDGNNGLGLGGGHFASNFNRFAYLNHACCAAWESGHIKVGIVAPRNIMALIIGDKHMSGYDAEWIQVVWFNQYRNRTSTKTLFGARFTPDIIAQLISNENCLTNPKYAYFRDGYIHNSLIVPGFSKPISIVFNNKECHSIFPRIWMTQERSNALIKAVNETISSDEFQKILQAAVTILNPCAH